MTKRFDKTLALPVSSEAARQASVSRGAARQASILSGAARQASVLSGAARQASPSISEAEVERAVLELNGLCKATTFDFAIAVGRLVIERFYGGDLEAWRSRGAKTASFRMLARHPELPLSPSALYRAVAVYELSRRLPVDQWKHICTSHLRIVLPLPREDQARFLEMANAQLWRVGRLREEVARAEAAIGGRGRSRGGRKKASGLRRTIRLLERCVAESDSFVGVDDGEFQPSPESAQGVVELMRRLQHACAKLETTAARFLPGAHTAPPPSQEEDGPRGRAGTAVPA
jgi:hypothetical protein